MKPLILLVLKVLESYFSFFFNEKSILYAKITLTQKKIVFKIQFSILYMPFILIVTIMSQILINV